MELFLKEIDIDTGKLMVKNKLSDFWEAFELEKVLDPKNFI